MSKGITDFHRLLLHAKVYQLFFFGNLPRLKFRAGEAAVRMGERPSDQGQGFTK